MGRFESYSKRKFKVSMVLFACMSWPWKAALTKPFKNQTHSQSQFSPYIHSENSSLHWFPIPTQQLLWTQLRWVGGTSAGQELWWAAQAALGRAVTPLPTGQVPAEHLHMDLVQLLLAWRAEGRQAAAQSQREAEQQPRPSSHPGSSDSGSKSWHIAGALLAPAVFSCSLRPLQVKVSRCDKLCSSAFLTFHIQKRAQDWEQEGTNLGNNIAEEFTQKYYVIY